MNPAQARLFVMPDLDLIDQNLDIKTNCYVAHVHFKSGFMSIQQVYTIFTLAH